MSREASGLTEDRKKVLKSAFFMAAGTLTSRILGLLRDVALGALFDRTITDAWAAAFRIPNLFRRLLGEGSISVSFIPVFLEAQSADSTGTRAKNLMNGLYSLILIVLGTLTVLGVLFTDEVLRLLLADNFIAMTDKWLLTVRLAQIMFGFVFFVCTYAYFMGVMNALGSFGLPALAPALLNIAMLVFTFLPGEWFSQRGDGLAWGVLVGGVLQATLLGLALQAKGFLPQWSWQIWSRDIRQVLRNLLPGILGMGLLQFITLVNLYFASSLQEGSISYLYWADRLLELPLSLISVSLGAALLPSLSRYAANSQWEMFRETAQESFLMNLFLAMPAALGLYFLAEPLVELLFLRGHFSVYDVQGTAHVLQVYALSLVVISLSRVLVPLYYAIKNTWYPAVIALVCLGIHIFLAPLLMKQQGLAGLVFSGLVMAFLNAVGLILGLAPWNLSLHWGQVGKAVGKFLIAGTGVVAILSFYLWLRPQIERGLSTLALVVTILSAMVVYFSLAAFLRCEQMGKIRSYFTSAKEL